MNIATSASTYTVNGTTYHPHASICQRTGITRVYLDPLGEDYFPGHAMAPHPIWQGKDANLPKLRQRIATSSTRHPIAPELIAGDILYMLTLPSAKRTSIRQGLTHTSPHNMALANNALAALPIAILKRLWHQVLHEVNFTYRHAALSELLANANDSEQYPSKRVATLAKHGVSPLASELIRFVASSTREAIVRLQADATASLADSLIASAILAGDKHERKAAMIPESEAQEHASDWIMRECRYSPKRALAAYQREQEFASCVQGYRMLDSEALDEVRDTLREHYNAKESTGQWMSPKSKQRWIRILGLLDKRARVMLAQELDAREPLERALESEGDI